MYEGFTPHSSLSSITAAFFPRARKLTPNGRSGTNETTASGPLSLAEDSSALRLFFGGLGALLPVFRFRFPLESVFALEFLVPSSPVSSLLVSSTPVCFWSLDFLYSLTTCCNRFDAYGCLFRGARVPDPKPPVASKYPESVLCLFEVIFFYVKVLEQLRNMKK
jgi:hypothetical protein